MAPQLRNMASAALRVVEAFECGAVVNPDGLRNQIEGAMIQAIGDALFEAVKFADGRIWNPHFAAYRVLRVGDVPEIEIVILDRKDLPSAGAGETPIVGMVAGGGKCDLRGNRRAFAGDAAAPGRNSAGLATEDTGKTAGAHARARMPQPQRSGGETRPTCGRKWSNTASDGRFRHHIEV